MCLCVFLLQTFVCETNKRAVTCALPRIWFVNALTLRMLSRYSLWYKSSTSLDLRLSFSSALGQGVEEVTNVVDRYLPLCFLWKLTTCFLQSMFAFIHISLRNRGSLTNVGVLITSQLWDMGSQWQHPSAAIAMAAAWNLLSGLLPVYHSVTALKATSSQANRVSV